MTRPAIGTRVSIDGLQGVVVGHRPQGMVDIRVDGEDFIARKRGSALKLLNPQKGSPPLRVRREVEKMLHNPPSSWKALYRRSGLPSRPSVDDFIDIVRSKTPSGRSAEAHYGQEMGEGQHVPTKAVREAALHGLRLSYKNNYTSQSGVGLARAVQLVLDPSIDDLAKTRMRAYLTRHERDKQGKNFGNDQKPSNGYMAWLNWGGDPAKEWLNMRNNPIFGFGRKKASRKDPKKSFQKAIDLYYKSNKRADEALILALNKRGDGHAWYWLPARQGMGMRAFESAGRSYVPKRYITAKDPTQDVIDNLMSYRDGRNITYVTIDTFTGKVTGPFKGSEVLPAAANPAGSKLDVKEKQDEQFRAVVQGIYESLMAKRLGVKSIYTPTGQRRDVSALRMGTLSKGEVSDIVGRAHAIATRQGQKHGYLMPGSQKPTAKGRRRAYKRQADRKALAQNEQDYEVTLSLARKSSPLRVVAKGRGKSRRFHVQPLMPGLNPKGYKTESAAKGAITRLRRNPTSLEEFANAVDGDSSTKTVDQMLADLAQWSTTAKPAQIRNAHRTWPGAGTLINTLIADERDKGLRPVQMKEKAARRLLAWANDPKVMRPAETVEAAEAIARTISSAPFQRTPQMTEQEVRREEGIRYARARQERAQQRDAFQLVDALDPKAKIAALQSIFMKTVLDILGEEAPTSREEALALQVKIQNLDPNVFALFGALDRASPAMPKTQLRKLVDRTRAFVEFQKGRFVPDVVGEGEVRSPAAAAQRRAGKEVQRQRQARGRRAADKGARGIAGVGVGTLSPTFKEAKDTTFTAPPGFEGVNYQQVPALDRDGRRIKDEDGNPAFAKGNIAYTMRKSGNMELVFGPGEEYTYELSLAVPSDRNLNNLISRAASPTEANRLMQAKGKAPLGLHQMYQDDEGNIRQRKITPEELQQKLNEAPEENFRQLAKHIVEYGFLKKKRDPRQASDRPVIAFTRVDTFDDKGKPQVFDTYVVYSFKKFDRRRLPEVFRRLPAPQGMTRRPRNQWVPWKNATGDYKPPPGTWSARASHLTVGKRGEWYVVGPLSFKGLSRSDQREYNRRLKAMDRLSESDKTKLMEDMRDQFSPRTFGRKVDAEAYRKRLDAKFGTMRGRASSLEGAAAAFYLDPTKAGRDGGYQTAVALANELRVTAPVQPRGQRMSTPDARDNEYRVRGVFFWGFPWRVKGEKIDKNIVSPQPPNLAFVMPGSMIAVQRGQGESDADFRKVRRDAQARWSDGTLPYAEAGKPTDQTTGVLGAEIEGYQGKMANAWDNAARSFARVLNLLAEARADAEARGVEPETDFEVKKFKKAVGSVAREVSGLVESYGLTDRPVVIALGLGMGGGVSKTDRGYVVEGPGRRMLLPSEGSSFREMKAAADQNLIVRSAIPTKDLYTYADGSVERKGTGSDVLNAVAFLLNWKKPRPSRGSKISPFDMPIFMAQVSLYRSLLRRSKTQTVKGYEWARARDPAVYLSRAFRRPAGAEGEGERMAAPTRERRSVLEETVQARQLRQQSAESLELVTDLLQQIAQVRYNELQAARNSGDAAALDRAQREVKKLMSIARSIDAARNRPDHRAMENALEAIYERLVPMAESMGIETDPEEEAPAPQQALREIAVGVLGGPSFMDRESLETQIENLIDAADEGQFRFRLVSFMPSGPTAKIGASAMARSIAQEYDIPFVGIPLPGVRETRRQAERREIAPGNLSPQMYQIELLARAIARAPAYSLTGNKQAVVIMAGNPDARSRSVLQELKRAKLVVEEFRT